MPTITYTLTNAGHNLYSDASQGNANPKITYAALGTSGASPTAGDTRLGAEVSRKRVTSYANTGATGEVIISMYLSPTEAVNVNIAEVGWFGGSNATNSANSGVLFARGLYSHSKTNLESITFPLDIIT